MKSPLRLRIGWAWCILKPLVLEFYNGFHAWTVAGTVHVYESIISDLIVLSDLVKTWLGRCAKMRGSNLYGAILAAAFCSSNVSAAQRLTTRPSFHTQTLFTPSMSRTKHVWDMLGICILQRQTTSDSCIAAGCTQPGMESSSRSRQL